jgi:hypothetical protein
MLGNFPGRSTCATEGRSFHCTHCTPAREKSLRNSARFDDDATGLTKAAFFYFAFFPVCLVGTAQIPSGAAKRVKQMGRCHDVRLAGVDAHMVALKPHLQRSVAR